MRLSILFITAFFAFTANAQLISENGKITSNSNSIFMSFASNDSYNPTIESFKSTSATNPGAMFISMGENTGAFTAFGREGGGVLFEEHMRLTQSGYLGIGTNSPNSPLQISNNSTRSWKDQILITSNSDNYGLAFAGQGHHRGGIYADNSGGSTGLGNVTVWARNGGDIRLSANAVNIDGKLICKTDSMFMSFASNDSYNPTIESFKSTSATNPGAMLISMGENTGAFTAFGREGGGVLFEEHMRLTQSGYLGIGTNSPNSPLQISNNSTRSWKDQILITSNSDNYGLAFAGQGHHRGGIYADNSGGSTGLGNVTVWARNGGDIRLSANAVNIDGKLISKTDSMFMSFASNDSYNPTIESFKSTSATNPGAMFISMGENTGAFMAFGREGGGVLFEEHMRLTQAGYLGIGTDSPDSKLTVRGNIHAREIKVTINAGADFVFADDYDLPKLEDVAAFVKENKHLPQIAPAAAMEKDGLELGEMNIRLLQKVEELTLYTIEQSNQIKELISRLEKLESK